MPRTHFTRAVFILENRGDYFYFPEDNLVGDARRFLRREDKDIPRTQVREVFLRITAFYGIPVLPDSFRELRSFNKRERDVYRSKLANIRPVVLITPLASLRGFFKLKLLHEHPYAHDFNLTSSELSLVAE